MKDIVLKARKIGSRSSVFSVTDDRNNILLENKDSRELISGVSLTIEENIRVLIIRYSGSNCCDKEVKIPISQITKQEYANIETIVKDTSSLWSHGTNQSLYNSFYGCVHPYILEHPYNYQYYDEIVQSISDYTKAYIYLPLLNHNSDGNRRVQANDRYFNKAILYNDEQSTGLLNLIPRPVNNMRASLSYPKYNKDSKDILYTKSDNLYQFNTFWNVVKNSHLPLFNSSCSTLSLDKESNQENMDYSRRSHKKELLRAKDLKVRLILDNRSDTHLVTTFTTATTQISYK